MFMLKARWSPPLSPYISLTHTTTFFHLLCHLCCRPALPYRLPSSPLLLSRCSRELPTPISRRNMILSHMHSPTPYSAVEEKLTGPACVCLYIHRVQKALEICTAVPCIIHGHSRRKELVRWEDLCLSNSSLHPYSITLSAEASVHMS